MCASYRSLGRIHTSFTANNRSTTHLSRGSQRYHPGVSKHLFKFKHFAAQPFCLSCVFVHLVATSKANQTLFIRNKNNCPNKRAKKITRGGFGYRMYSRLFRDKSKSRQSGEHHTTHGDFHHHHNKILQHREKSACIACASQPCIEKQSWVCTHNHVHLLSTSSVFWVKTQ